MFQPQPTPFSYYAPSYGLTDAFIPDTRFHQQAGSLGGAALPQFLYASPQAPVSNPSTASPAISAITQFSSIHQSSPPQPSPALPEAQSQSQSSPSYDTLVNMEQRQQSLSVPPTQQHQQDSDALQRDIAAQEAAAREYQPQLEGPLVGEKESSHAIVQEYAKAHPVYVAKTAALPQTYSHYRRIQGDGNCGWRAMGFGYFECLIESGDQDRIESEVARVMSLNHYIATYGGFSLDIFEDMADMTIQLLKDLAMLVPADPTAAMDLLMQRFNDRDTSSPIIYHLRLLASSLFKQNPDAYVAFIPDDAGGVDGYCRNTLEIVDREIDAVGVVLLYNMLLKPLDIVLEITYLDTSPGTLANIHRWPDNAKDENLSTLGPMICLLYRPDHYDMLYTAAPPPVPVTISQAPLQVNRVAQFVNDSEFLPMTSMNTFATLDFNPLTLIPGFGEISSPMYSLAPQPMASSVRAPPPAPVTAPPPMTMDFPPTPVQDAWAVQHNFPPDTLRHDSVIHALAPPTMPQPAPHPQVSTIPPPQGVLAGAYPIRFGKEVWDLSNASLPEPTYKNSIFKNTPFNRAHYNNPQFHPEQWSPDDEMQEKGGSKRRKHRAAADKGTPDPKLNIKSEPA